MSWWAVSYFAGWAVIFVVGATWAGATRVRSFDRAAGMIVLGMWWPAIAFVVAILAIPSALLWIICRPFIWLGERFPLPPSGGE